MRFAISLGWFGYLLDFSFGPAEYDEPEATCSLDGGTTSSYPVGFSRAEVPWEDNGSLHQFDPGEDAEDV